MLRIKTDGNNQLSLSIILKHDTIIIWNLKQYIKPIYLDLT